jgi:hypothetical protein
VKYIRFKNNFTTGTCNNNCKFVPDDDYMIVTL